MIEEKLAQTAAEFWEILSPQKPLFGSADQLLYRGQADAKWNLTPSVLREPENRYGVYLGKDGFVSSDTQVFKEWMYLKGFAEYCDAIGRPIPNDSNEFRDQFLNLNAPAGPSRTLIETSFWPHKELYDLMALGQHHGLPTRLLDWSTRSYVAAYFAISGALQCAPKSDRLAVWVFNLTKALAYSRLVETIRVPGGNNANLAAQRGVFTLLRQSGHRGQPFLGQVSLDEHFLLTNSAMTMPLLKVSLPTSEACAALALCELYGVTGATLFPDYYGASRAAVDMMRTAWRVSGHAMN